jgi:hypothetical protein
MKDILLRCYHDDMSVAETISFIEKCYGKVPGVKVLNNVKAEIKRFANKDWK